MLPQVGKWDDDREKGSSRAQSEQPRTPRDQHHQGLFITKYVSKNRLRGLDQALGTALLGISSLLCVVLRACTLLTFWMVFGDLEPQCGEKLQKPWHYHSVSPHLTSLLATDQFPTQVVWVDFCHVPSPVSSHHPSCGQPWPVTAAARSSDLLRSCLSPTPSQLCWYLCLPETGPLFPPVMTTRVLSSLYLFTCLYRLHVTPSQSGTVAKLLAYSELSTFSLPYS